jgi:hypothetical protein
MYCSTSAPPKSAPLDALTSVIDKLQATKNVRFPNECKSSEDLMVIAIPQNIERPLHLSSPVSRSKLDVIVISDDSDSDSERKPDVIVISDDSDSASESPNAYKMADSKKRAIKPEHLEDRRPAKRHALNPEVIEILDSSGDEGETTQAIKAEPRDTTAKSDSKSGSIPINIQNSPAGSPSHALPKDTAGRIIVTRKVKVDAVEHLEGIPSRWPVPSVDTAYVLDFSDDMRLPDQGGTAKGKPKGLDVFLKAEVCDYHHSCATII